MRPSVRSPLGRPFEASELRRIKRLWVRHTIAEDARDIDGLLANGDIADGDGGDRSGFACAIRRAGPSSGAPAT